MMESGDAANAEIQEISRTLLRNRLFELAQKGEGGRSIPEYVEYRKLLSLWHQEKI